MIRQRTFEVDPWTVREAALNLDQLAQSESVFALSNGHIGLRGNLDEGEPHGLPGTYLGGFFEFRPLPYAEAGYGYPESGQTVVNVTNGKLIRLLVGDALFDVRYGTLRRHERTLDLRAGTLTREVEWVTPDRSPDSDPHRPPGLLRAARDRRDHVRGRAARRQRAGRPAVRAGRQRAASLGGYRSPRRRGGDPASLRVHLRARPARRDGPHHRGQRPTAGGRDGPPRRGTRRSRHRDRGAHRLRPRDHHLRGRARQAAAGVQVTRLRVVEPALDAGGPRSGRGGADRRPAHGLGRAAQGPAPVPRRVLVARRRRDRRRSPPAAGAAVRNVPRPSGRRPGRGTGDRGQGVDRIGLRRPRFLGHRDLRAADAHPRRTARGSAGAHAGATRPFRSPRSAPRSSASREPRFPGGRSGARSARATGRPAPPRFTSTPTSPTRSPTT